jgi:hypothetical protein
MSTSPIATYSFLPWLRQGIANQISSADGDPSVILRAKIPVNLEIAGETSPPVTQAVNKNVELYGPGDILGIEPRAIVRTEPRRWITNFESNYLPFIEFYDEDFPWRYTPAAPDGSRTRLRPWLTLVVLRNDQTLKEFENGVPSQDRPLPYIKLASDPATVFPPADQLWAWAHVHVNRPLAGNIVSTDMNAVLPAFQNVLRENADLAYSRIICPRRLAENAGYDVLLIPTFESGRLAGLGLDFAGLPSATHSAWTPYANRKEPTHYPVYFRWDFRTGSIGDFEYLVRLLKPKPVDKRVGTRDIDVQKPGSNVPGITNPELNGILKLGGALRVPLETMKPDDRAEVEKYDQWFRPFPHEFQTKLAGLINLTDDYATTPAEAANTGSGVLTSPDPVITPPLYGRWHSLTSRLLKDRDRNDFPFAGNWVHELNLDPRFRVPAGFGTRVVQDNQEEYMNAAWEQVGEVLEANRRIRYAQFARETAFIWHERHLRPLMTTQTDKFFQLAAPLQKRVVAGGSTVFHHVRTSRVQTAAVSAAFRRMSRPRARLVVSLPFEPERAPVAAVVSRINSGEVSAAPPKQVPAGVLTVDEAIRVVSSKDIHKALHDKLHESEDLVGFVKQLAALIHFHLHGIDPNQAGEEQKQTVEAVDRLPESPDFKIAEPGSDVRPRPGTSDSREAVQFKTALKDANALIVASQAAGQMPERVPLNVRALAQRTHGAINPDVTVQRYAFEGIQFPSRFAGVLAGELREVMAYPIIDTPMYKPLTDRSAELFLPNIDLIEQNSLTLLETNQRFIEAYMVGLNHEFSRELLWREYPTDMMGSYFRQFWDVSAFFDTSNLSDGALKEKLRDIPELHTWHSQSRLGEHDNREEGTAAEEEVVLVIRGELLKKYDRPVIYAQKARWQLNPDGTVDRTQERRLVDLTAAELDKPPRTKLKTPLYESKVAPDIRFIGFDLTALEARGDTGDHPDINNPGWFFIIKERPGEPRFGFDLNREGPINTWNDLAWSDAAPGVEAGGFIQLKNDTPAIGLTEPTGEVSEKHPQWEDDRFVSWDKDMSAADVAYILYQVPVLIAVHASEMLPR